MIPEICRKVNGLFVNSTKIKKESSAFFAPLSGLVIQFFSASFTNRLVLIDHDLLAAAAKDAVALVLFQNDGVALGINFHGVAASHAKGLAQFNGKSNSAQVVDVSDHAGRFHLYFLTDFSISAR